MTAQAIYIRTSTSDQDGQAQLHALRLAAQARGWTAPREFIDLGHSGTKAHRPALDQLRQAAKAGSVRVVMVAALDRLGRSLRDLLHLLDELTACGCAVVSLRESIDLTTPTGRLLVQIIAALAEFEREIICERVRAGIARAQQKGTRSGKPIGRPSRHVDVERVIELRQKGGHGGSVLLGSFEHVRGRSLKVSPGMDGLGDLTATRWQMAMIERRFDDATAMLRSTRQRFELTLQAAFHEVAAPSARHRRRDPSLL